MCVGLAFFAQCVEVVIAFITDKSFCVGVKGEYGGGDVVDEKTVVGDKEDGAVIGVEGIFERLQRIDVEVVGRFVEDEEVGFGGHHLCKEQAAFFASRERLDEFVLFWHIEQKSRQKAAFVDGIAVDVDVVAVAQGIVDGFGFVESLSVLGEVGNMGIFADDDLSGVGIAAFGQNFEQGRFAASVGANDGAIVVFAQLEVHGGKNRPVV